MPAHTPSTPAQLVARTLEELAAQWQVVERLGWVTVRYGKSGASVIIGTNAQEAAQAAYWLNYYGGAK